MKRSEYHHDDSADYKDEQWLREEYAKGRSQRDLADEFGVDQRTIQYWMDKFGIDSRTANSQKPPSFGVNTNGYEWVRTNAGCEDGYDSVKIHRLAAVAWFGFDAVAGSNVHHKSGHRRDNREDNFEVMSHGEHSAHHGRERGGLNG